MPRRILLVLPLLLTAFLVHTPIASREPFVPKTKTKVPAWDTRGFGTLPWQGVACLDVNDDASRIVVGTIAPSGDPNILLLDGDGKLVRQQNAGQRWIEQIAVNSEGDNLRATL
jgi:hypothetical protein